MGPLMPADDDLLVQVVEVVLVHEERVAGAGEPVALGQALGNAESRAMSQATNAIARITRTIESAALP